MSDELLKLADEIERTANSARANQRDWASKGWPAANWDTIAAALRRIAKLERVANAVRALPSRSGELSRAIAALEDADD